MSNRRNPLYSAVHYALAVGLGSTGAVFAQDQDQDEDKAVLDRVEVTGSRIKRADIESASPARFEIRRIGFSFANTSDTMRHRQQ